MTAKVSVVIPVYNALPYLEECLDTVRNQTLRDIEIICVDDGSTDGSLDVLKAHAAQDDRILVLQQNENAGAARNNGLEHATGDYIVFLDADDFFDEHLLEHTYNAGIENNADIVLFDGHEYDQEKGEVREDTDFLRPLHLPDKTVFNAHDIPDHIFQVTNPSPWSQIYRRAFLMDEDLRYQTIPNTNDAYMTFAALASAERVVALREDLLRYRVFTRSSTQDGKWRYPLCVLEAFSALEKRLMERGLYDELRNSFLLAVLRLLRHNLYTIKNYNARMQILNAIESGEYLQTPLLRPASEYPSKQTRTRGLFLVEALRQRDRMELEHAPLNYTCEYLDAPVVGSTAEVVDGANGREAAALRGASEKGASTEENISARADNSVANAPLVSIIVPLTASDTVLDDVSRTIDSVAQYTSGTAGEMSGSVLPAVEVIVVTAGSGFETSVNKALKDRLLLSNVPSVICHIEQVDVSMALNAGMEASRGSYLLLLHAGDELVPDALSTLSSLVVSKRPDLLWIGSAAQGDSLQLEGVETTLAQLSEELVAHGPELMRSLFVARAYDADPRNYVFSKDHVYTCNLRFRQGMPYAEVGFTFTLLVRSNKVAVTSVPLVRFGQAEDATSFEEVYGDFSRTFGLALGAHACLREAESHMTQWRPEQIDAAARLADVVAKNALALYRGMPLSARGGRVALGPLEQIAFDQLVLTPAQLLTTQEQRNNARTNLDEERAKNRRLRSKLKKAGIPIDPADGPTPKRKAAAKPDAVRRSDGVAGSQGKTGKGAGKGGTSGSAKTAQSAKKSLTSRIKKKFF